MFLICLLLWILFNGRVTLEILVFGVVIAAGLFGIFCALFGYSLKKDIAMLRNLPGIVSLAGSLLVEIIRANMAVTKMIYSKKQPAGCYTTFRTDLKTRAAQIALADCITLTPGTITGLLEDGEYTVHCLDESFAQGISDSVFVRRLKTIEKEQ